MSGSVETMWNFTLVPIKNTLGSIPWIKSARIMINELDSEIYPEKDKLFLPPLTFIIFPIFLLKEATSMFQYCFLA